MQLKSLGIDNILGFDWISPPAPESMIRALEVLYSLGVLDDDAKLTTPTGFQVAEIPLVFMFIFIPFLCMDFLGVFGDGALCGLGCACTYGLCCFHFLFVFFDNVKILIFFLSRHPLLTAMVFVRFH